MIKLGETAPVVSTYSTHSNCVRVASPQVDAVLIDDSKRADSPVLRITPDAFAAFVASVK